jgi:hypothetical protein
MDMNKPKQERKLCLFCENYANSKEDTFPLWLLEVIGKQDDMVKRVRGLPTKIQKESAVLRIRTVCEACNNGWMSQVEEDTIAVLRPLLLDLSISLSSVQQTSLAVWVMKTGMVLDSIYTHVHFYQKDERKDLRENKSIPTGTVIWIGRFFGNGKHAGLSDFSLDCAPDLKVANGCVITLILGHVVLQILSVRPRPDYKERPLHAPFRPGKWRELLSQIWPNTESRITWPPALSFTLYSEFSVSSLLNRFRPMSS